MLLRAHKREVITDISYYLIDVGFDNVERRNHILMASYMKDIRDEMALKCIQTKLQTTANMKILRSILRDSESISPIIVSPCITSQIEEEEEEEPPSSPSPPPSPFSLKKSLYFNNTNYNHPKPYKRNRYNKWNSNMNVYASRNGYKSKPATFHVVSDRSFADVVSNGYASCTSPWMSNLNKMDPIVTMQALTYTANIAAKYAEKTDIRSWGPRETDSKCEKVDKGEDQDRTMLSNTDIWPSLKTPRSVATVLSSHGPTRRDGYK